MWEQTAHRTCYLWSTWDFWETLRDTVCAVTSEKRKNRDYFYRVYRGAGGTLPCHRAGILLHRSYGSAVTHTPDLQRRVVHPNTQPRAQEPTCLGKHQAKGPEKETAGLGPPTPVCLACETQPLASRWFLQRV